MAISLNKYFQAPLEASDEWQTVSRLADDLLGHLSTDNALARISEANQPGQSSAVVQATFGQFVREMGFESPSAEPDDVAEERVCCRGAAAAALLCCRQLHECQRSLLLVIDGDGGGAPCLIECNGTSCAQHSRAPRRCLTTFPVMIRDSKKPLPSRSGLESAITFGLSGGLRNVDTLGIDAE